jgi:hypothetical protein
VNTPCDSTPEYALGVINKAFFITNYVQFTHPDIYAEALGAWALSVLNTKPAT